MVSDSNSDKNHSSSASVHVKSQLPKVVWIGILAVIFLILASSDIISSWSAGSGTSVNDYVHGVLNRLPDSDQNKSTYSGQQDSAKDEPMPPFGSESIAKMEEKIVSVAETNDSLPSPYSWLNNVMPSPPLSTDSRPGSSVNSAATASATPIPVWNSHTLESSVNGGPAAEGLHIKALPTKQKEAALPNKKECDLYHGKWVYDARGPLYKNDSCPVLTQKQNCQGNGRPDKNYENWRWKPNDCDIPRFDGRKFLELMRGKTLGFIGDSLARNQMKSLLCILWQVEVPTSIRSKRMQRYDFASTSTTILRIWSAWLVNTTTDKFGFAPDGLDKVHLDVPDEGFMEFIPQFDITVINSGHWYSKKSAYILDKEIVGGKSWWPNKSRKWKLDSAKALGMSIETVLSAIVTHPNYKGLTIFRTYSPAHYEKGTWNTGGKCAGNLRPLKRGEMVANKLTTKMYDQQVRAFSRSIKKMTNKSKLKLMDITEAFGYRHDGHPGPYRGIDPNKFMKPGRDGKLLPQDCGHWCMPGPVDTWNEILFEIIRREYSD